MDFSIIGALITTLVTFGVGWWLVRRHVDNLFAAEKLLQELGEGDERMPDSAMATVPLAATNFYLLVIIFILLQS